MCLLEYLAARLGNNQVKLGLKLEIKVVLHPLSVNMSTASYVLELHTGVCTESAVNCATS